MHNKHLFLWALTSALAGFLFGFDTVVISGAEQTIQKLWELNSTAHGLAISMALWGTVLGSLLGGWPTEYFGRKKTLVWIGILYFVSAIGSAYAFEEFSFMFARFIGGLAVGFFLGIFAAGFLFLLRLALGFFLGGILILGRLPSNIM